MRPLDATLIAEEDQLWHEFARDDGLVHARPSARSRLLPGGMVGEGRLGPHRYLARGGWGRLEQLHGGATVELRRDQIDEMNERFLDAMRAFRWATLRHRRLPLDRGCCMRGGRSRRRRMSPRSGYGSPARITIESTLRDSTNGFASSRSDPEPAVTGNSGAARRDAWWGQAATGVARISRIDRWMIDRAGSPIVGTVQRWIAEPPRLARIAPPSRGIIDRYWGPGSCP
jgi:hypothetical protein